MAKVQILVATMHQNDFSKVQSMNLSCDAIFANQCDRSDYQTSTINNHSYVMISTPTRGVGINRNMAMLFSNADFLLFADDDLTYYDDLEKKITDAFTENRKADVIILGMDFSKKGKIYDNLTPPSRKIRVFELLKYGTYCIAVRKESIDKKRLKFSELFGGGCIYSHGEDSSFLLDCYRAGLRIYGSKTVLGVCAKDSSTCFEGYNSKYFYNKGAWIASEFGLLRIIVFLYYWARFKVYSEISGKNRWSYMHAGMKGFKSLMSYEKYCSLQSDKSA